MDQHAGLHLEHASTYWFLLHLICRDHDGKVTPEEVAAAAAYLKDTIGKEGVQELISKLSKDKGAYTHDLHFPVHLMTLHAQIVLTVKFLCLQMERSVWKT